MSSNNSESKKLYLYGLQSYPLMEIEDGVVKFNIFGQNGIIAFVENDETFYPIKDHLGSTRVLINNNCQVVSNYKFDVMGKIVESEISQEYDYLFTGQEFDEETGLFNYKARLYDADIGRFYSVDPMHEFANPYSYCNTNPVNFVDLSGYVSAAFGKWCGRLGGTGLIVFGGPVGAGVGVVVIIANHMGYSYLETAQKTQDHRGLTWVPLFGG